MVDNQQNVDPVCFPLKIIACASARLSSPILALAILKKGEEKKKKKISQKLFQKKEFKFASLHVRPHDWVHPLWPDHATDPNPIHISTPSHLDMRWVEIGPPIGRGRVCGGRGNPCKGDLDHGSDADQVTASVDQVDQLDASTLHRIAKVFNMNRSYNSH